MGKTRRAGTKSTSRGEGIYPSPITVQGIYRGPFKHRKQITEKKFRKVLKRLNTRIVDAMLYENLMLVLPNMGTLEINKHKDSLFYEDSEGNTVMKRGNARIDFNASRNLWQTMWPDKTMEEIFLLKNKPLVHFDAIDTDGYSVTVQWDKSNCHLKCKKLYKFIFTKGNNHKLKKSFLSSKNHYPIVVKR